MFLYLDGWKLHLQFSACHFIPYQNKCERLHGHTYAVSLMIHGKLNKDRVLIDFGIVKNAVKKIIREFDHKIILPKKSKIIKIKVKENVEVNFDKKYYSFPISDVLILNTISTSAEDLANYIAEKLLEELNFENIEKIEVGLDEGFGQGAWVEKFLGVKN